MRTIPFYGGEHNNGGEEVGKKKSKQGEPGSAEGESNSGSKEPVTITNPAPFGEKVEEEIETAKDNDSEKRVKEEAGWEWGQSETSANTKDDDR